MEDFHSFFSDLYSKKENSRTEEWLSETNARLERQSELETIMNASITVDEVKQSIKGLKRGKAAGIDGIPNELLKESCHNTVALLTHLFNQCLKHGVYPWNTTVITPIHKKGPKHDPNNYRAIAVGSSLGRVFSAIYLERLVNFRKTHCPDPPNQQGFVKNAQTSDHLLTLHTLVQKHTKKKERLYTCFIDFRKAFDCLNRDALLLKLLRLGLQGNCFNVLRHMYNNSKARLKLAQKLSNIIDIAIGTEQGHVTSPELFKCFLLDLSTSLNDKELSSDPALLNNVPISHLFWADDLVLISRTASGLQKLLDVLHGFSSEWDLTVNTTKTAVMVFNHSGRKLKESEQFLYGSEVVPSTKHYQYLGMVFSLNGSTKAAQQQLKAKSTRSIFSLKKILDLNSVSKQAALKLFDALVAPVAGYASPIWLPGSELIKSALNEQPIKISARDIWKDIPEACHTSFLRWLLGLRKNTSLAPAYGDTGRTPLAIQNTKQLLDFHNRLKIMSLNPDDSEKLVVHAYKEQELLNLPWFQTVVNLAKKFDSNAYHSQKTLLPNFTLVKDRLTEWYWTQWDTIRRSNNKLEFYNQIKEEPGFEAYLETKDAQNLTRLRSSSHRLKIETGRHKGIPRSHRYCDHCCSPENMELLCSLPFADPLIQDEWHMLTECSLTQDARESLRYEDKTTLSNRQFPSHINHSLSKLIDIILHLT